MASQDGHAEVVDVLVKAGADVNQATTEVSYIYASDKVLFSHLKSFAIVVDLFPPCIQERPMLCVSV